MNDLEFEEQETDSTESAESSYCNVPEMKERRVITKAEWKRKIDDDFLELEDRMLRGTIELEEALEIMELKKRKESGTLKLEENNSVPRRDGDKIINRPESEKRLLESQDRILRKVLELEEAAEKKKKVLEVLKLPGKDSVSGRSGDKTIDTKAIEKDVLEYRQTETQIPLMGDESVSVVLCDGSGQEQLNTNKRADLKKIFRSLSLISEERRPSVSSAMHKIMNAKKGSKSALDCCKNTVLGILILIICILCIIVVPSLPIAMIVIGSLYIDECTVQPYIPVYLVVSGAWGTFYSFAGFTRQYCAKPAVAFCFDVLICLFLFAWFICGCVWVYGVTDVEFENTSLPEYCHQTVYLFAFWFLNCIFILLGASVAACICSVCCGICCGICCG